MFTDLDGKSALVTGASSGLGLHFARLLASRGTNVVLAARRTEALEAAVEQINAAGPGVASAVSLDVTDAGSCDSAVASLDTAPDILINNAGVTATCAAIDMTEDAWDRVVDTNLKGAFLMAQAVGRRMREEERGGAIVNVASILGLRVAGGLAAYAASKAAIVQLTRSLALEWARHGIRVNALCPGYVETDLNREFFASDAGKALIKRIPQRRLGQLQDLDAPLLMLASDDAGYMTGTTLAVDGGHLVSSL